MLLGAGGGVVENNLLIDSPKIYLMLLEFESLSNQGSLILTTNSVLLILAINTLGNRPTINVCRTVPNQWSASALERSSRLLANIALSYRNNQQL